MTGDGGDESKGRPSGGPSGRARSGRPVFLVGMMGCGKSSVGPALARRLGRPFVDNDRVVEQEAGASIAEIFAREGESGFRARERRAIEACRGRDAVVALGGGAIAQPGATERLAEIGVVVYLRAGVPTLLQRVGDGRDRPLLAGLDAEERRQRLEALLAERESAYRTAQVVVDTDGLDVEAVAAEVAARTGEGSGVA